MTGRRRSRPLPGTKAQDNLKEDRALRIETVINDPGDLGCKRSLEHLTSCRPKARACNARLMDAVIAGQGNGILANPVTSGSRTHL